MRVCYGGITYPAIQLKACISQSAHLIMNVGSPVITKWLYAQI